MYHNTNKLIMQVKKMDIKEVILTGVKMFLLLSFAAWALALPIILTKLIK